MTIASFDDGKDETHPEPQTTDRSKSRKLRASIKLLSLCSLPSRPRAPLYTALPPPDTIRLLRIHPGKQGRKIRCSLQFAHLHGCYPSYEALSYVWLCKPGQEDIICNGHKKKVTTNLFDALERLRYPTKSRLIWVDALCINQEDDPEKSVQVRKMNHIYRKASRVVVWLGTDDHDEAHPAFSHLCVLVNAHCPSGTPVVFSTLRKNHSYCIRCTHLPPPLDSKEWYFVMALFINQWWSRAWVLQEIVLARSATFIWGKAELDWSIIGRAIDIMRANRQLQNLIECRNVQNAYIMHQLGELQKTDRRLTHPFLHLLDLARSFDVTKPKDKVFSLLGFPNADDPDVMSESAYSAFVPLRYETEEKETYTYVARKIVACDQSLDVLSFTSHISPDFDKKSSTMATWVPNWNSKDIIYPFMGFEAPGRPANRHRAGNSKAMEISPHKDPNVLLVKGVVVDTITDTSASTPLVDLCDSTPNLKILLDWCVDKSSVSTSVLSTTLTAGRDADGILISDTEQNLADFIALLVSLKSKRPKTWPNDTRKLTGVALRKGSPEKAMEALWRYSCYRSAFITASGKLGLGPGAIKKEDVVAVLWGGQVPYVLREDRERGRYVFVGECYIDGLMKCEVGKEIGGEDSYKEIVFELR